MSIEIRRPKKQRSLITSALKKIEQKILKFYLEIGRKSNLNLRLTEIYAYFRIYESLTQKQLKQLTGFSSSTISTALQSFIQTGILTREFLQNTHTNIYTLIKTEFVFAYSTSNGYFKSLEQYDNFIENLHEKSQELIDIYPRLIELFHRRLNGIRNHIEACRRAYTGKKKNTFFEEDVSDLISTNKNTNYPPEIKKYEEEFVNHFVKTEMFVKDDPIINKLLSFLTTRVIINQEMLINLTGFSRSTISRNLSIYGELGYVSTKKEYLKPRVYSIPKMSLYLINVVLTNNQSIVDWIPKFEEILNELKSNIMNSVNLDINQFLTEIIKRILDDIRILKKNTQLLTEAQKELQNFLKKK
ncbi:MAG: hypothetical protein HZR80_09415 [Candidatus Heimdallarchaeota archaeon]